MASFMNNKISWMTMPFSGQGKADMFPELNFVHIELQLPNTKSKLQPMNAGIIFRLKILYGTAKYSSNYTPLPVLIRICH